MDDTRTQRIEERLAWLERHVLAQDKAMLELAKTHDALRKQFLEFKGRVASQGSAGASDEIFDGNEKPPHY